MPEVYLVLNTGSSSVKASVFMQHSLENLLHFHAASLETEHAILTVREGGSSRALAAPKNHEEAIDTIVEWLSSNHTDLNVVAVGHRFVHGGTEFREALAVDQPRFDQLQSFTPLAPLHLPENLQGLDRLRRAYRGIPQIACFDTAFHAGRDFIYEALPLPRSYYDRGLRRFGFHGLSYEYIARRLREIDPTLATGRVIVGHLGNGASLCAMLEGRSVETTMSFSPLDGIPMSTRSGSLDPGMLLYLLQHDKQTPEQIEKMLYSESGLKGIFGESGDVRELLASTNPYAKQAVEMFVTRTAMAVASLSVTLGGLDGIVFTAGIGENSVEIRQRICEKLVHLGVHLDRSRNDAKSDSVSAEGSPVKVCVIPTDEEKMIAIHVAELLKR